MKTLKNTGRVLVMLIAIVIGGIPFLMSVITTLLVKKLWLSYILAFVLTIAVTLFSAAYPETFRFGDTDLRVHDGLWVSGMPAIYVNIAKNLLMAYLGVIVSHAFLQGYKERGQQAVVGKRG